MSNEPVIALKLGFLKYIQGIRKGDYGEFSNKISRGDAVIMLSIDAIERETGESTRVSELIRRTGGTPQGISRSLRNLEDKGLIDRLGDKSDRRVTVVIFTSDGLNVLKEIKNGVDEFFEKIVEKMGENDINEFIRLSKKLSDIMSDTKKSMFAEEKE